MAVSCIFVNIASYNFSDAEFEVTKKGHYILRSGGHTYWSNWCKGSEPDKPLRHWYCSKRKKFGCGVRIKTFYGRIVAIVNEHSHDYKT